ncbi:MAG: DUF6152 family protein [Candidatus Rariloculaceae bacterium]
MKFSSPLIISLRIKMLCAPLFFLSLIANAHHSTSFNYSEETVTLDGTITNLKWINPHSSMVFRVLQEDGTVDEYLVEFLAKIALERGGFDFDVLQNGMLVNLTGRIGFRDGFLRFQRAILANGRVVTERSPLAIGDDEVETSTR